MKKYIRKKRLNEDVTTSEVRSIVSNKLDDLLKEREFEKRVKEITANVVENLYLNYFIKD